MFTRRQQKILRAAVNRIIPADDYPSGWDAGVGDYLNLLLMREPRFFPIYQIGLDALDAQAQEAYQSGFAKLTPDAQDALLARTETGFLRLLIQQTQEGFYADPGCGGNKNGIAWQMIGYQVTA